MTMWADTDEAPRKFAHKSFQRREQMVGDAVQLSLDLNHWNRVNPMEEPIELPMDFTCDIEWAINGLDDHRKTA